MYITKRVTSFYSFYRPVFLHSSQIYISSAALNVRLWSILYKLRRLASTSVHIRSLLFELPLSTSSSPLYPSLSILIERSMRSAKSIQASFSRRAIGSALVDRLKLQSRIIASRGKRRPRSRSDGEGAERLRGVFGSSLIDIDPIDLIESTEMMRGRWRTRATRALICLARFQFLLADLKEDAVECLTSAPSDPVGSATLLARLKLPVRSLPLRSTRKYRMDILRLDLLYL